jgi:pyruvate/2-oxoglutarate dehydrogenase complex dihydrolipoamide acyltransferase (E2) component
VKYRFVGDHLETLDDGQGLAPGDFTELSEDQEKGDRASELIKDGQLIPIDEGEGPTEPATKLAKENNVDLAQVHGTGAGGRITKEDVQSYIDKTKEGD